MHYEDWRDHFSTLYVNNEFPGDWTGVMFKSAWTEANSGGLPSKMTPEMLERYAKNPQFLIKPENNCKVMISLCQNGGRMPIDDDYCEFPFLETFNTVNLAIFRIDDGHRYLQAFDQTKLASLSPIQHEREITARCNLYGDATYVVVPTTELPGKTGEFHLSVYVDQDLRDVEIKRVYHPLDTMQYVEVD